MQFIIVYCRRLRPLTNKSAVLYRWKEWQPGFPMSIDANRHKDLPRDIQFDSEKGVDFVLNYSKAYVLPLTPIMMPQSGVELQPENTLLFSAPRVTWKNRGIIVCLSPGIFALPLHADV